MRWQDKIDWDWIVDESRITHETQTYNSIADAVEETARFYRKSALRDCPDHVEIWVEKAGLGSIIWEVASDYDVPVVVSKGMPSLSQLYACSRRIAFAAAEEKETYIYQFGDHDPSGCLIPEVIENRINQFCERWDCRPPYIERVALTEDQIDEYRLPTRPTKRRGNPHAKNFEGDSVELDALPARVLRDLVNECIEQHISSQELNLSSDVIVCVVTIVFEFPQTLDRPYVLPGVEYFACRKMLSPIFGKETVSHRVPDRIQLLNCFSDVFGQWPDRMHHLLLSRYISSSMKWTNRRNFFCFQLMNLPSGFLKKY